VKRLVAAGCDGMSVSDAFLMHTDARGRYGIDWEIIPLGENVPVFDQFGHLIDTLRVSDTVRVCAWNDEAKGSVNAVLVEGGTVTADIVIR
jgi:hypothetical protein